MKAKFNILLFCMNLSFLTSCVGTIDEKSVKKENMEAKDTTISFEGIDEVKVESHKKARVLFYPAMPMENFNYLI